MYCLILIKRSGSVNIIIHEEFRASVAEYRNVGSELVIFLTKSFASLEIPLQYLGGYFRFPSLFFAIIFSLQSLWNGIVPLSLYKRKSI